MVQSINDNRKKRGRPATGLDPMWGVRFPAHLRDVIDAWAKSHDLTRAEAIRRLTQLGLDAEKDKDSFQT